ncbi:MAG: HD domain-containing protein [Proteobacteria bacterium]|nr:HD domain-containing protein [Pseudomonadota bacterium]MBU1687744.1 HD domain-containing protein [Pseudomonadota bacterium]
MHSSSTKGIGHPGDPPSLLPLGEKRTAQLLRAAATFSETTGGCHGTDHADRVHQTALYMGRAMEARLDILSAAALLHDIGRADESASRGTICHAARGAELSRPLLVKLDFTEADVEAICHCIATHRFRDRDNPPESIEAKILFDADKLDSIGAIGIGRAFLFAGQVGARLHNAENIDLATTNPYTEEDTACREFRIKLSKIRDLLLTELGREMARDRHQFMELFFHRLETEIKGGSHHDL